jgi:thermitase
MVLLALTAFADDGFHPDAGDERVSFGALLRSGDILGRTGHILGRADDPDAIRGLAGVAGVRVHRGGLLEVTPTPGTDDLALSRQLHDRADVRWATPDLVLPYRLDAPDDPFEADEWHLENTGQSGRMADVDIDADTAWTFATGKEQMIAIIDSGTQLEHPDLRVTAGHDYVDGDDDPSPLFEDTAYGPHGTCAAGVAAAAGNNGYGVAGVAYDADIYAIRLIGGTGTTLTDQYDAFLEAVDAGADVLSNSWGFDNDCSGVRNYGVFGDMFDYAETEGRDGLGSVVVFAAGNGGCDIAADKMLAHDSLLVVAAVEWWDTRAWYSNFGDSVNISAPTGLLTTDLDPGGYGSYGGDDWFVDGFNGTSAATPVVAGVAALMFEANPRLTAAQVRQVICDTAVRIDAGNANYNADGWSPYYGCGLVDAGAAVAAVADSEPEAPIPVVPDEVLADDVVLSWAPSVDADDDVIRYEVRWGPAGEADGAPIVPVQGTSLDIGDEVTVGERVEWRVRAVDPWGNSVWSPATTLVVAPVPEVETPKGCNHAPNVSLGLLAALLLRLRGRRTP